MIAGGAISFCILCITYTVVWMVWRIQTDGRRIRSLEIDNTRLIRRLGEYHNLPLGPVRDVPFPLAEPEVALPPAFKTKRPQPPPGWAPKHPGDPGYRDSER